MNAGDLLFVIEIPPKFEYDVLSDRRPAVQVNIDATALTQAGVGASYLQNIIAQESLSYAGRREGTIALPINLIARARFNPNLRSEWFNSIMSVINNITLLAIVLVGAALLREREHGTVEHLLVMPVKPAEIMVAKIWANGLVIVLAATASVWFVVHEMIGVPLAGSLVLFVAGTAMYHLSVGALGVLLATFTGSIAQFSLLVLPVVVVLDLLSGSTTPMESMPVWLQQVMQFAPTTHYVRPMLGDRSGPERLPAWVDRLPDRPVVYVSADGQEQRALLSRVGKHKMGKVCLYFKQLADLDTSVLERLVVGSIAEVRQRYG